MSFIYLITKGFEDSFTCDWDTTDSVRCHLRANKIDLSLKKGPEHSIGRFLRSRVCYTFSIITFLNQKLKAIKDTIRNLSLWSWFRYSKYFITSTSKHSTSTLKSEGRRLFRIQWLGGPCSIFFRNRHPRPLGLVFSCFIQRTNWIFSNSSFKMTMAVSWNRTF